MRYEGGILFCKSRAPYFTYEKNGLKNNTIRVVEIEELVALAQCSRINVTEVGEDAVPTGSDFSREITSVFDVTDLLPIDYEELADRRVVLISWRGSE